MFWLIYNSLWLLGFPVIILLLLTKKRSQRGLCVRLGKIPNELHNLSGSVVWVHAASLGEVTAIVPLLKAMKEESPAVEFVVSTVTETGREIVLNQLRGIATHCYAPLDVWWAVKRYVRILNPRLFLLVESEIWPNLLASLQSHDIPVCLVNGRISTRSFSRYQIVKRFMKTVWSSIDLALMQTTQDADRIRELGARADVVHVTGNMKFDLSFEHLKDVGVTKSLRSELGIQEAELVIVAGSTHSLEETYLLQAYRALCGSKKNIVLVIAPRHIERASELERVIAQHGLPCVRRSQMSEKKSMRTVQESPRVILLDSRGELPYVYSLGVIGFVGGTLVPVGGHNLLEPAQWARPVFFGSYVDHCRDIAQQLLQAGGAIQISQPDALVNHFLHLLDSPAEAEQMGQHALSVIQKNRGVVKENLRMIRQLISHSGPMAFISPQRNHDSFLQHPNITENPYESSLAISP